MKTRTNVFYTRTGAFPAAEVDRWINTVPGELIDVKMVQNGNYGVVVMALYKEHDTTDWGPG